MLSKKGVQLRRLYCLLEQETYHRTPDLDEYVFFLFLYVVTEIVLLYCISR